MSMTEQRIEETAAASPELASWLACLAQLIEQVERWSLDLGWQTRRIDKPLTEGDLGTYHAPALALQEGTTRILLEPIARSAPGAEGVVDLYLMPGMDDITTLYYFDGRWQIGDATLTPDTFRDVLSKLRQNAA